MSADERRWRHGRGNGARGPAQLVLTASVARRYYLDGQSKVEIAEEFALSRFKVARLLDDARNSGLVRIEIGHPGVIDVELSGQLMDALGLMHCVVTDTPDEHPAALARALWAPRPRNSCTEIATRDDVLGPRVGPVAESRWPRAASARPHSVVQLTGALVPSRGRRQLDRAGAGGRAGRGRARATSSTRRWPSPTPPPPGPAPATRGGSGVLVLPVGDQGRRRRRGMGPGAVHPLRRHGRRRADLLGRLGVCADVSGVLARRPRRAGARRPHRAHDRHHAPPR